MSVVIPTRAQRDIDIAAENIGRRYGQRTAQRFLSRLARLLALLERLPESAGEVDPPFPRHPGLRVAQPTGYPYQLVYYVPTPTGIRVVRLLNASIDTGAIFG